MTDDELRDFATDFREGVLGGAVSDLTCFMVCAPLETLLNMHGIKCEMVETDLGAMNHFWLKMPDGRALDPTADQFNKLFPDLALPPVYLGAPIVIHGVAS